MSASPGELVALVQTVTLRRKVGTSRVTANVRKGEPVGDVSGLDNDALDHLLRTKQIGRRNGAPYVSGRRTSS